MAQSERLQFRIDDELRAMINRYKEVHNLETESEAARQMMRVGYRERQSPLMHRFKAQVIDYAADLGIFAVIVVVVGFLTPILSPADAALLAVGLAATAVVLLSAMSLARVAAGTSELGVVIRELIRRENA